MPLQIWGKMISKPEGKTIVIFFLFWQARDIFKNFIYLNKIKRMYFIWQRIDVIFVLMAKFEGLLFGGKQWSQPRQMDSNRLHQTDINIIKKTIFLIDWHWNLTNIKYVCMHVCIWINKQFIDNDTFDLLHLNSIT